ncbi:hypothetical protein BD560DRAFT_419328 [Blakeslea trispora]|nr:hypothetical protein BD560DRAFT_419328 [Blakeslea trispora]
MTSRVSEFAVKDTYKQNGHKCSLLMKKALAWGHNVEKDRITGFPLAPKQVSVHRLPNSAFLQCIFFQNIMNLSFPKTIVSNSDYRVYNEVSRPNVYMITSLPYFFLCHILSSSALMRQQLLCGAKHKIWCNKNKLQVVRPSSEKMMNYMVSPNAA